MPNAARSQKVTFTNSAGVCLRAWGEVTFELATEASDDLFKQVCISTDVGVFNQDDLFVDAQHDGAFWLDANVDIRTSLDQF